MMYMRRLGGEWGACDFEGLRKVVAKALCEDGYFFWTPAAKAASRTDACMKRIEQMKVGQYGYVGNLIIHRVIEGVKLD